jgi:hypothetical protein
MTSVLLLNFLLLCMPSLCNAQKFIPFSEFLLSVEKATYKDYASTPVRDEYAFLEIKEHILNMYGGVTVPANVRSYLTDHGYTDCILYLEQSSIHLLNLTEEEKTPPQDDEDVDLPDLGSATDGVKEQPIAVSLFGDPNAVDVFGNPQHCPKGTVPQRRLTLDRITRFGTLYNFFAKVPFNFTAAWNATDTDNGTVVPKRDVIDPYGFKHLHEVVYDGGVETFVGGGSAMNVWKPRAGFSISQIWLTNQGLTQTIESGWVVGHGGPFDDDEPHPFIYYTTGGYAEGTGCYNTDCPGFVMSRGGHNLRWDLALTPSTFGGRQYELRLVWKLRSSQWRLYFQRLDPITNRLTHNHRVGFYPASLFRTGNRELGTHAVYFEVGGEVAEVQDAPESYGEMGSGRKVTITTRPYTDNYGRVAYQRAIHKMGDRADDATETWDNAMFWPAVDNTAERCYNKDYYGLTGFPDAPAGWGSSMFFGGPGGEHCDDESYPRCRALGCRPLCRERRLCPGNPRCTDSTPGDDPPCCPSIAGPDNAECRLTRERCRANGCGTTL